MQYYTIHVFNFSGLARRTLLSNIDGVWCDYNILLFPQVAESSSSSFQPDNDFSRHTTWITWIKYLASLHGNHNTALMKNDYAT